MDGPLPDIRRLGDRQEQEPARHAPRSWICRRRNPVRDSPTRTRSVTASSRGTREHSISTTTSISSG
jgi:hypothetical protein